MKEEKTTGSEEAFHASPGRGDDSSPSVLRSSVSGYRLFAELFLHPDERDAEVVREECGRLEASEPRVAAAGRAFLENPAAGSAETYIATLELSAPVSLYLGAYLFEEPRTCGAAASSERNAYMIEMGGIYRHFGLDPTSREMPDFLPLVLDFLWRGGGKEAREAGALRRYFLERYVSPALPKLRRELEKCGSPYAALVEAVEILVGRDLESLSDTPAWKSPRGVPVATKASDASSGVRLAPPTPKEQRESNASKPCEPQASDTPRLRSASLGVEPPNRNTPFTGRLKEVTP